MRVLRAKKFDPVYKSHTVGEYTGRLKYVGIKSPFLDRFNPLVGHIAHSFLGRREGRLSVLIGPDGG
jgi:hypothetical protein